MSGMIFFFLMTRRILVPKDEEIWFRVCNKDICFGKRQFAVTSGLSVKKSGSRYASGPSKLMAKYYSSDRKLEGKHLHKFLFVDTVAFDATPNDVKNANKRKIIVELET
ncbi:hypothetical protein MKX01_014694 [Papaver californicum]|nr:hypothetical protein MKX01_014694 [Papaver californicum]